LVKTEHPIIDCLIFRNQDLTQDQINRMHAHKSPRCTFLIDQIGAIKFNEFQRKKYQNFEVRIETGRKKSSDLLPDPNHLRRMKVVPITEEDTFGAKIESTQKFEILRNQLECRYCLKESCKNREIIFHVEISTLKVFKADFF